MIDFGPTEAEYDFVLPEIVGPSNKSGVSIYCFGSRARGDHQKNSDLDLMVVSDKMRTSEISNFPFIIDLVQEQNFSKAYRVNYLAERRLFKPSIQSVAEGSSGKNV